jgi:hypothetical protein
MARAERLDVALERDHSVKNFFGCLEQMRSARLGEERSSNHGCCIRDFLVDKTRRIPLFVRGSARSADPQARSFFFRRKQQGMAAIALHSYPDRIVTVYAGAEHHGRSRSSLTNQGTCTYVGTL